MEQLCGQPGVVVTVDHDDDVRVKFDDDSSRRKGGLNNSSKLDFLFHPNMLIMIQRSPRLERPSLATLMPDPMCKLSSEQAESELEKEAEALMLRAMPVLEASAGDHDESGPSARKCAVMLIALYAQQGRKKERKAMEKRKEAIEGWCDESSDDSSDEDDSDDSGDSDDSDDDDGNDIEVQHELMRRFPRLTASLQDDNDHQMELSDLLEVLEALEIINNERPAKSAKAIKDRKKTKDSLEDRVRVAMRRDRAAKLLAAEPQSVRREAEEMTAKFSRMGISHLSNSKGRG